MILFCADDFQDDPGPVPVKKVKSTVKAKQPKTKQDETKGKSKEPGALKRKER